MKEKTNKNKGLITLLICGIITVGIIIACVFFPDQIFGFLQK